MDGAAPIKSNVPRRPWVAPVLVKHESLSALTQQDYGPYPPGNYPPGYPVGVFADSIPGSTGFFVG